MPKPRALNPGRPVLPDALYRKVADQLRARFARGDFPPLTILPSLVQLAGACGVGRETARAAVDLLRTEGWIISNAQGRLVSAVEPSYARQDAGLVLLVFGTPLRQAYNNLELRDIFLGCIEALGNRGHHYLVAHDFYLRTALPDRYLSLPLAGILLLTKANNHVYEGLARLPVPAVLVDVPPSAKGLVSVAVDNQQAAFDACARLIALGHRRIALIRSVSTFLKQIDPDSQERERGFTAALRNHGLNLKHCPILSAFPKDRVRHQGIEKALTGPRRITAAICVDNGRGQLMAHCAKRLGLTVPRDLSLVTFSGIRSKGIAFSGPKVNFHALGGKAVEVLLAGAKDTARVPTIWQDTGTLAAPNA